MYVPNKAFTIRDFSLKPKWSSGFAIKFVFKCPKFESRRRRSFLMNPLQYFCCEGADLRRIIKNWYFIGYDDNYDDDYYYADDCDAYDAWWWLMMIIMMM